LLGISPLAHAQVPPESERPSKQVEAQEEHNLRWSGRVFVGSTLVRAEGAGETAWNHTPEVKSARMGMRYDGPDGLRAVIKVEFAEREADLKDGYIRKALPASFRLTAGRFKKPISAIALASKWDLPSVERGLLDAVLVEGKALFFAGSRADGLMLDYRAPTEGKTGFSVAFFQDNFVPDIGDRDATEDLTLDPYLRLYAEPVEGVHLASTLALIAYEPDNGSVGSFGHAPVGTLEVHYKSSWLRAWAEAVVGDSVFPPVGEVATGRFVATRALVSSRIKVGETLRVEPFVGASFFDPRTGDANNSNTEVQGGVNLAFTKNSRLQFEVAHVFSEGVFSSVEKTNFFVQLATRIKE
jgi:hypothetical protein